MWQQLFGPGTLYRRRTATTPCQCRAVFSGSDSLIACHTRCLGSCMVPKWPLGVWDWAKVFCSCSCLLLLWDVKSWPTTLAMGTTPNTTILIQEDLHQFSTWIVIMILGNKRLPCSFYMLGPTTQQVYCLLIPCCRYVVDSEEISKPLCILVLLLPTTVKLLQLFEHCWIILQRIGKHKLIQ